MEDVQALKSSKIDNLQKLDLYGNQIGTWCELNLPQISEMTFDPRGLEKIRFLELSDFSSLKILGLKNFTLKDLYFPKLRMENLTNL